MGVDARILLKITDPNHWLDAEELRHHSARLASVIGHSYFFIDPKENRHTLAFVRDQFLEYLEDTNATRIEEGLEPYSADDVVYNGIVAKGNEQFIEVNVWSRYYGEGYPRGDWKLLYFVILWCLYNIPSCEVWYGGDDSEDMEQMTPEVLASMSRYYLTTGHDEYFKFAKGQYKCEFCGIGVEASGGGGDHKFFRCNSCGGHWILKSDGFYGPKQVCAWGDCDTDNRFNTDVCSFTMSNEVQCGTRKLYPFDGTFRITYRT